MDAALLLLKIKEGKQKKKKKGFFLSLVALSKGARGCHPPG